MAGAALGEPLDVSGARRQKPFLPAWTFREPRQESKMVANFCKIFRPVLEKHLGCIDVNTLKLRSAPQGGASEDMNCRFDL
jgi:hypothetical protein